MVGALGARFETLRVTASRQDLAVGYPPRTTAGKAVVGGRAIHGRLALMADLQDNISVA